MAASINLTEEERVARSRLGAHTRWNRPKNVELRLDALAEHVRKVVDALPPLTDAQRAKLAALLGEAAA